VDGTTPSLLEADDVTKLGIDLDELPRAERRDLANALLRAAWSAVLEDRRIVLLDLLVRGGRHRPGRSWVTKHRGFLLCDAASVLAAPRGVPGKRVQALRPYIWSRRSQVRVAAATNRPSRAHSPGAQPAFSER
jgi:hypothetical protein